MANWLEMFPGLGSDHLNDVDLNDIQQIEVVRGPSSLLYSNGTMGGIINIVDQTITSKDFEGNDFNIGLEAQSLIVDITKFFLQRILRCKPNICPERNSF